MPSDEVNGPEAFATLWLVLGVTALVLIALWPVLVWLITRPRPVRPVEQHEKGPVPAARETALAMIEQVRLAAAAGQVSPRVAHQSVSTIVRSFVSDVTGTPADRMDLSELRALARTESPPPAGLADVADWVEVLYPPEFSPDADRSVDQTCDEATALVRGWS